VRVRRRLIGELCATKIPFRLQEISRASLPTAINPIPPEEFPLQNYVLCSEEVAGILSRRASDCDQISVGLMKLKGFPGCGSFSE
jgi:hypothetical protein